MKEVFLEHSQYTCVDDITGTSACVLIACTTVLDTIGGVPFDEEYYSTARSSSRGGCSKVPIQFKMARRSPQERGHDDRSKHTSLRDLFLFEKNFFVGGFV